VVQLPGKRSDTIVLLNKVCVAVIRLGIRLSPKKSGLARGKAGRAITEAAVGEQISPIRAKQSAHKSHFLLNF